MKNKLIFSAIFSLILFLFSSCQNTRQLVRSVPQELKDLSYTIFETSIDYSLAKAENEIKPFFFTLKKDEQALRTYLSPLGFLKFEVGKSINDSLVLSVSPVWLNILDSCKSKVNYYLRNESDLLKVITHNSLKKVITNISSKIKPFKILLTKNSIGQFFSPNKLIIVEVKENDKEIFIKISPNLAEMGEIVKIIFKQAVGNSEETSIATTAQATTKTL